MFSSVNLLYSMPKLLEGVFFFFFTLSFLGSAIFYNVFFKKRLASSKDMFKSLLLIHKLHI